jgi:hypothetical protein
MYLRIAKFMDDGGPKWKVTDIEMAETPGTTYPLFHRDPIECAKALLANPTFTGCLDYAPDKIFNTSQIRVYHEMASGRVWNEMQVSKEVLPTNRLVNILIAFI